MCCCVSCAVFACFLYFCVYLYEFSMEAKEKCWINYSIHLFFLLHLSWQELYIVLPKRPICVPVSLWLIVYMMNWKIPCISGLFVYKLRYIFLISRQTICNFTRVKCRFPNSKENDIQIFTIRNTFVYIQIQSILDFVQILFCTLFLSVILNQNLLKVT